QRYKKRAPDSGPKCRKIQSETETGRHCAVYDVDVGVDKFFRRDARVLAVLVGYENRSQVDAEPVKLTKEFVGFGKVVRQTQATNVVNSLGFAIYLVGVLEDLEIPATELPVWRPSGNYNVFTSFDCRAECR